MIHTRFYRLLISVILFTLLLPASLVQADSQPAVSLKTGLPPEVIRALCPPYDAKRAGNIEYMQQLPPECMKLYRKESLSNQQARPEAAQLTTGGPDVFGYTFNDGTSYEWISAGTSTGLTGDDEAAMLDIGFNFPFYGINYSQLYFSTNGLITFEQPYAQSPDYFEGNIPDRNVPNNYVAPFWEDLVVGPELGNPAGGIYYQTFGTAPNRYLVLEWRNVDQWDEGAADDFSFEAILFEDGDIKIQHQSLPSSYSASAGIENSLGTDGLLYGLGNFWMTPPGAVLFTYPVTSTARVLMSPLIQGTFTVSGGTPTYTIQVANTGSMGIDTYDLYTNCWWPRVLYAADGVTELTDTDADDKIDTGPIAPGSTSTIILKMYAPAPAVAGDTGACLVAATSSLDAAVSEQVYLYATLPGSFANAFVDQDNLAMSLMMSSRSQSTTYKLTADGFGGKDMAVIRLLNGNYLYAWFRSHDNGNAWVYEIEYAILAPNGKIVRGVTKLTNHAAATIYTLDQEPSLAVAPNGTVGIAWSRHLNDSINDISSYNIYFATLDSAGNLLTGPTAITSNALSSNPAWLLFPTIAATDDNRFLLGWEHDVDTGTAWEMNLYIAGRNTAGASVFPPKAFTSNNQSWGSIFNSLKDGKAILTWMQDNGGPYYAVINSSGATSKAATDLTSMVSYPFVFYPADAVLLPNGKTAIAYPYDCGAAYSVLDSSYNIESVPTLVSYNAEECVDGYYLSVTTDASSHVIMSWMAGDADNTQIYAMATSEGSITTAAQPYNTSSTALFTSWNGQGIAPFGYSTDISIGTNLTGRYEVLPQNSLVQTFASVQNGPVKVSSPENRKLFTSERVISGSSFNEVMGFPNNQLTTEYWFPWYDNKSMATWILVGNPTAAAAKVDIYVAGVKRTSATIPAGGRITPRYAGVQGGPVRVVSTNGVKIFTSERSTYGPNSAFNEMMGYPANQFTNEYWFPWYDNTTMATSIVVGNSSTTSAATVSIYIGGVRKGSYTIAKGGTITQRYTSVQAGPVRVVSTNNVPIVTSERTIAGTSFNEVLGSPANQFTTEYWFPWYDNTSMSTWVLVGNPSTTTAANVDIYIGGIKRASYVIAKGGRITPRFSLNAGPVQVVSTNGVKIFASERVMLNGAFNEVMGYPGNKLDTLYWFPWYDSTSMSTDIVVGTP